MTAHDLPGGVLVAIEGIDGAGKTTQIQALEATFARRGWRVVTSKEPTAGPWGRRLRESAQLGRLSPEEELAAFIEDRKEHVSGLIAPALADGRLVLLDRYYFSTIAYQGIRGRDPGDIRALNEAFAPRPDLLVVMDLDPVVALQRIRARGDVANEFERLDLLRQSRELFLQCVRPGVDVAPGGRRCIAVRVDASRPSSEITEQIAAWIVGAKAAAIHRSGLGIEDQLRAVAVAAGGSLVL